MVPSPMLIGHISESFMATIGTVEAAKIIGVSSRRVVAMIHAGQLKAKQIGQTWVIDSRSAEALAAKDRPTGRPKGS